MKYLHKINTAMLLATSTVQIHTGPVRCSRCGLLLICYSNVLVFSAYRRGRIVATVHSCIIYRQLPRSCCRQQCDSRDSSAVLCVNELSENKLINIVYRWD